MMIEPRASHRKRILLVEDEQDIAQLLQLNLAEICEEVCHVADGVTGLEVAQSQNWDLIILDLHLPRMNGLDICKQLRAAESYTPILMLTAKSTELDRVLGLELGADDYVTKPFSVQELNARVKALFRRCDALGLTQQQESTTDIIQAGDLSIDLHRRQAKRNDELLELTAREFDLLHHFASNPGRVYNRTQLLDSVWGYGHDSYEHTVNSHINRLRAKIEPDPSSPTHIITVWGVGYRFGD